MASKGLRAISYQGSRKVEAGYKPSHITETLIGYIVCCAFVLLSYVSVDELISDTIKFFKVNS